MFLKRTNTNLSILLCFWFSLKFRKKKPVKRQSFIGVQYY